MRKLCFISRVLTVFVLIVFACDSPVSAQPQKKATPRHAGASKSPAVSAPSAPDAKAVRGGVLKCTRSRFPKVIGYAPEMGPVDGMFLLPVAERLVDWDERGGFVPTLAESWETDPQNKTLTWRLRKGVKFQDGTPFNGEAVRWNMQLSLDGARLPDGKSVKSLEVLDDYTIRMNLTELSNMAVLNYGSGGMLSPTAFKANGGKEWARTHAVGTGPFKLVDFKRDTIIKYERNNDYWRKGLPLLDGIEIRFVPDAMTALMMLESKESDVCLDGLTMKNVIDLQQKGLRVNWGPGMLWSVLPNSKDPKSPYANKLVREAVEYAIDRNTLAKTLGFGRYEALTQIVPSNSPAYVPGYNPRPYNPEKARHLLGEAGYPNGFDTKLLTHETASARDAGIAIQSYLAAVGIRVTLDPADIGRYYGSVFGPLGWSDLALVQSGINPDGTDVFAHFGPRPFTFRFGNPAKTPEYLSLCEKALKTYEPAALKTDLRQVVRQAGEDAMTIPLLRAADAVVTQPYVHTDYLKIHSITWFSYRDWMEPKK